MTGEKGDKGDPGTLEMADFWGNVASGNLSPGSGIPFAQNGPNSGSILRITNTSFQLTNVGIYEVMIQVPIQNSGQVIIALNGVEQPYTVAGGSMSGNNPQIVQKVYVQTTAANTLLEVRFPTGNTGTMKVVNSNGGNAAVSAHLIITRVK